MFGGGCFWCTEAVFSQLKGVVSVVPGYAGGHTDAPTYKEVCGEQTGHAEVINVRFDPEQISYNDLLTVFFASHDPTTLNRQGADVGTRYRSVILYADEEQQGQAEDYLERLKKEYPIVTQLAPLEKFFEAEDYHHNFYLENQENMYCQLVIDPKMQKFRKQFEGLTK